jgi:hypothetical protein
VNQLGLVQALNDSASALSYESPREPNRGDRACLCDALGVPNGEILHAAIRVVDEAVEVLAAQRPDGHLQGVEGEVGAQGARCLPADHVAREDVDDESHMDPAAVVFTYVRSATHKRFGADARNWRSTRSAGRVAASPGNVVRTILPRTTPRIPRSRIKRSTVQRAIWTPSRRNWAQTLSAPYTRRCSF